MGASALPTPSDHDLFSFLSSIFYRAGIFTMMTLGVTVVLSNDVMESSRKRQYFAFFNRSDMWSTRN